MITFLKIFFGFISLCMVAVTVSASTQSNLFAVFPNLLREPWMVATLQDFYFNILILFSWVIYKERKFLPCLVWFIAFATLGSIATAFYVLVQLVRLKPGEGLDAVLLRRA